MNIPLLGTRHRLEGGEAAVRAGRVRSSNNGSVAGLPSNTPCLTLVPLFLRTVFVTHG
jgi:hypothetical protein